MEKIGKYVVTKFLKAGAQGSCFVCTDPTTRDGEFSRVAVKIIRVDSVADLNSALHESRIVMELQHENIVKLVDTFAFDLREGETYFSYVMRFYEHGDLQSLIFKKRTELLAVAISTSRMNKEQKKQQQRAQRKLQKLQQKQSQVTSPTSLEQDQPLMSITNSTPTTNANISNTNMSIEYQENQFKSNVSEIREESSNLLASSQYLNNLSSSLMSPMSLSSLANANASELFQPHASSLSVQSPTSSTSSASSSANISTTINTMPTTSVLEQYNQQMLKKHKGNNNNNDEEEEEANENDYVDEEEEEEIEAPEYQQIFSEKLCILVLQQICQALQFIHEKNIIHRDIKPANILIEKYNGKDDIKVVLADFGLVRKIKNSNKTRLLTGTATNNNNASKLTLGVGTEIYMAPYVQEYQKYILVLTL